MLLLLPLLVVVLVVLLVQVTVSALVSTILWVTSPGNSSSNVYRMYVSVCVWRMRPAARACVGGASASGAVQVLVRACGLHA
jgi:hypothetical protein